MYGLILSFFPKKKHVLPFIQVVISVFPLSTVLRQLGIPVLETKWPDFHALAIKLPSGKPTSWLRNKYLHIRSLRLPPSLLLSCLFLYTVKKQKYIRAKN